MLRKTVSMQIGMKTRIKEDGIMSVHHLCKKSHKNMTKVAFVANAWIEELPEESVAHCL